MAHADARCDHGVARLYVAAALYKPRRMRRREIGPFRVDQAAGLRRQGGQMSCCERVSRLLSTLETAVARSMKAALSTEDSSSCFDDLRARGVFTHD